MSEPLFPLVEEGSKIFTAVSEDGTVSGRVCGSIKWVVKSRDMGKGFDAVLQDLLEGKKGKRLFMATLTDVTQITNDSTLTRKDNK